MAEDRLPIVRQMIMAGSEDERRRGARAAASRAAVRLRGDLRGHARAARDDPAPRPAAARVPAAARGGRDARRWRSGSARSARRTRCSARAGCRLGLLYPEIYEMQVRAIVRAALAVEEAHRRRAARRDHAPARRLRRGAPPAARAHRSTRPTRSSRRPGADRLPRRHDDRAAAGVRPRGRDRRGGRLLQLRHERPDPDDARLLPRRRRGQVPHALPRRPHPRGEPVRDARPVSGVGDLMRIAVERAAARSPRSSSASAASTAAIRARSRSATTSGSTTSRARPTAFRSPGSPPPRRRSPRRA